MSDPPPLQPAMFPRRPIYPPLPLDPLENDLNLHPDDIYAPDSSDDDSADTRQRKRRRILEASEAAARGEPLFILSAGLRGSFGGARTNPWRKKKRAVKTVQQPGRVMEEIQETPEVRRIVKRLPSVEERQSTEERVVAAAEPECEAYVVKGSEIVRGLEAYFAGRGDTQILLKRAQTEAPSEVPESSQVPSRIGWSQPTTSTRMEDVDDEGVDDTFDFLEKPAALSPEVSSQASHNLPQRDSRSVSVASADDLRKGKGIMRMGQGPKNKRKRGPSPADNAAEKQSLHATVQKTTLGLANPANAWTPINWKKKRPKIDFTAVIPALKEVRRRGKKKPPPSKNIKRSIAKLVKEAKAAGLIVGSVPENRPEEVATDGNAEAQIPDVVDDVSGEGYEIAGATGLKEAKSLCRAVSAPEVPPKTPATQIRASSETSSKLPPDERAADALSEPASALPPASTTPAAAPEDPPPDTPELSTQAQIQAAREAFFQGLIESPLFSPPQRPLQPSPANGNTSRSLNNAYETPVRKGPALDSLPEEASADKSVGDSTIIPFPQFSWRTPGTQEPSAPPQLPELPFNTVRKPKAVGEGETFKGFDTPAGEPTQKAVISPFSFDFTPTQRPGGTQRVDLPAGDSPLLTRPRVMPTPIQRAPPPPPPKFTSPPPPRKLASPPRTVKAASVPPPIAKAAPPPPKSLSPQRPPKAATPQAAQSFSSSPPQEIQVAGTPTRTPRHSQLSQQISQPQTPPPFSQTSRIHETPAQSDLELPTFQSLEQSITQEDSPNTRAIRPPPHDPSISFYPHHEADESSTLSTDCLNERDPAPRRKSAVSFATPAQNGDRRGSAGSSSKKSVAFADDTVHDAEEEDTTWNAHQPDAPSNYWFSSPFEDPDVTASTEGPPSSNGVRAGGAKKIARQAPARCDEVVEVEEVMEMLGGGTWDIDEELRKMAGPGATPGTAAKRRARAGRKSVGRRF